MTPVPLPIDPYLPAIVEGVRGARAIVVTAAPGAGKTTRVPPALAADGPVIVLQPRRVAARAIARRIADEQGWTLGGEVGWQVRFERRFSARTRILLATEGILTARFQQDPLLSSFVTVILDEFHERSVHADLGLALARQAFAARDDLRLVVMSATLDTTAVASFLGGCPTIEVPGRAHPLDIDYRADQPLEDAIRDVLPAEEGSVLCFLPGAPEINRALPAVRTAVPEGVDVLPLHGSLAADDQERALRSGPGRRRIILATNIAETSLTVPGVHAVVDTGLHKVARYDPDRGIDSLDLERIPADSAAQRGGRAGRLGPGRVRRLWGAADRLRPHGDAEIHRVDLADAVLQIVGWSGDPRAFAWFDPPPVDRVDAALALLERLGAIAGPRLTDIGRTMQRLPLHPRLSRMLIEGGAGADVARACALLSERGAVARAAVATRSDLLSAVENEAALTPHLREAAHRLQSLVENRPAPSPAIDREAVFLRAVFAGYGDRVARRRGRGTPRFLLASGHGAVLARESGVHDADFIVAVEVHAGPRGAGSEALIRVASAIDDRWLAPTQRRVDHEVDADGRVKAVERVFYDAILLREQPVDPDLAETARVLAAAFLSRPLSDEDGRLIRRLRFASLPHDIPSLIARAVQGRRSLSQVRLADGLDRLLIRDLERLAPQAIDVPTGRAARLDYREDGTVVASIKLQELFGLADSPRIGPRQAPVVIELLAPNGRPVQTTRDLRSFWNTTYAEVRRELRGRYPKHPWPEDPWTARPTARTQKGGGRRGG